MTFGADQHQRPLTALPLRRARSFTSDGRCSVAALLTSAESQCPIPENVLDRATLITSEPA